MFDLASDPHETRDLAEDPAFTAALAACETELRAVCDPETVDGLAHADQAAKVEAAGGKTAILSRGVYDGSPVPGEPPRFASLDS